MMYDPSGRKVEQVVSRTLPVYPILLTKRLSSFSHCDVCLKQAVQLHKPASQNLRVFFKRKDLFDIPSSVWTSKAAD